MTMKFTKYIPGIDAAKIHLKSNFACYLKGKYLQFFFLQRHFSSRNREITLVYFETIVYCETRKTMIAFSCL